MPVTGESGPRAYLIYERLKQVSAGVANKYYSGEQASPGRVSRFMLLPGLLGCLGDLHLGPGETVMPGNACAFPGMVFSIR